jgi:hypothetical protein
MKDVISATTTAALEGGVADSCQVDDNDIREMFNIEKWNTAAKH